MLTAERLRELLEYDPVTGVFRRRFSRGRCKAGSEAGNLAPGGRWQVQVDGRNYKAHRLAWLYMTGEWPAAEVDHANCLPSDNRWENLREASHSENMRNRGPQCNNTSGVKGVAWNASLGKWQAQICVERRQIHLGVYSDIGGAAIAYASASERLHGEFGRTA